MKVRDVEARIVKSCVHELLMGGYRLSVDAGMDDYQISLSGDERAVVAAMMKAPEESLVVYEKTGAIVGGVVFTYGSEAYSPIAEISDSVEPLLKNTLKFAVAFE